MTAAIRIPEVEDKVVAVLGLARSGRAAAEALAASGAIVWAWDDAEDARLATPAQFVVDLNNADWSHVVALLMSPGIPTTFPKPHPIAAAAKEAGVPLISDIELLYRAQPRATFVGITGTNGKSTVTTLIGHILKSAGRKAEVGGNLGQAVLTLPPLGPDGVYVVELSSYQLDITPTPVCDVAVLLNITPDHLDRHGGMEGYIASKRLIMRPKGKSSLGIIGVDDAPSRAMYEALRKGHARRMVPVSAERAVEGGVSAANGKLVDAISGKAIEILDLKTIERLPGQHNWQNAAAAYAVTRALGLGIDEVVAGLRSYPGLVHRQELVATLGGIRFVNDSKATNADAAAKALACYDDIYWIAGGKPKEGGLAGLESYYPHIRCAYLIGEAADAFARQLGNAVASKKCGTLDKAVTDAAADARAGKLKAPVVLLSPACASFDQYPNFEVRGDHFRKLVQELVARSSGSGAPNRGAA
ncbi:MAG TPA: UDP-N-acetylmuramoyl-L-alanine--D-glutamate ligase [Dongiaceae bacterium]|jgi:UDP-N-acetylmuramoylalanine--D-glutamate ligase|nr:UDP-N-acetylmuramoyl-L-alanine--D-glutamate ligase [Dongiaceae bacterium]